MGSNVNSLIFSDKSINICVTTAWDTFEPKAMVGGNMKGPVGPETRIAQVVLGLCVAGGLISAIYWNNHPEAPASTPVPMASSATKFIATATSHPPQLKPFWGGSQEDYVWRNLSASPSRAKGFVVFKGGKAGIWVKPRKDGFELMGFFWEGHEIPYNSHEHHILGHGQMFGVERMHWGEWEDVFICRFQEDGTVQEGIPK